MDLPQLLRGRRLFLVRHGNTGKAEVDSARELTEKGRHQCERSRGAWAEGLWGVTRAFASPVLRTVQTASLLAEPLGIGVVPVEDLYFVRPWRTEAMRAADNDVGYAPVRCYIEKYPGVHQVAAERMAAALAEALLATAQAQPEGDVLVVGHAGYISFLALEVLDAIAPPAPGEREAWLAAARAVVLDANMGEACGFELGPDGARYMLSPEATDFGAATNNDAFTTTGPERAPGAGS